MCLKIRHFGLSMKQYLGVVKRYLPKAGIFIHAATMRIEMNDVQKHLESAIEAISKEKKALFEQIQELETQEEGIQALINPAGDSRNLKLNGGGEDPLIAMVKSALNSNPIVTVALLREIADKDGISYKDGRSINAIFINMARNRRVTSLGDGKWQKKRDLVKLRKSSE